MHHQTGPCLGPCSATGKPCASVPCLPAFLRSRTVLAWVPCKHALGEYSQCTWKHSGEVNLK